MQQVSHQSSSKRILAELIWLLLTAFVLWLLVEKCVLTVKIATICLKFAEIAKTEIQKLWARCATFSGCQIQYNKNIFGNGMRSRTNSRNFPSTFYNFFLVHLPSEWYKGDKLHCESTAAGNNERILVAFIRALVGGIATCWIIHINRYYYKYTLHICIILFVKLFR